MRAVPVPLPELNSAPKAPRPSAPRIEPPAHKDESHELLWEREKRLAAEALLQETDRLAQELQQDLDSANVELRALNHEIQALTAMIGRTPLSAPPPEN
jgi:hypothetical protein